MFLRKADFYSELVAGFAKVCEKSIFIRFCWKHLIKRKQDKPKDTYTAVQKCGVSKIFFLRSKYFYYALN